MNRRGSDIAFAHDQRSAIRTLPSYQNMETRSQI